MNLVSWSAGLPDEVIALEESVDESEELLLVFGRELVDLSQSLQQALTRGASWLEGLEAEELVGGDAEDLDECRQQVRGRMLRVRLVVGDHALGDAKLFGEIALGQAGGLA